MILARRALHAAQMAAERHRTARPWRPRVEVVSVPAGTCGGSAAHRLPLRCDEWDAVAVEAVTGRGRGLEVGDAL